MIEETLERLESLIQRVQTRDPKKRAELKALLQKLKGEIGRLEAAHVDQARSIAGFTEVAAHEATRRQPSPELLKLSLDGLARSVKTFEASHPRLTETVNEICGALAALGI